MPDDDELHALYRYRGKRKKPPLYIGRTNNPMRRAGEHQKKQPWITETARIDVRWYYADEIADVERLAIQREHPVYNFKHNRGQLHVEVAAEVTIREPSGDGLFFIAMLIVAGGMGAAWAADSLRTGTSGVGPCEQISRSSCRLHATCSMSQTTGHSNC